MKTKLFTKNSYVAMLMALVLALGVQGNLADAATVTESTKSYDLLTLPSGGGTTSESTFTFNIRFNAADAGAGSIVVTATPVNNINNIRVGNLTDSDMVDKYCYSGSC